MKSYGEFQDTLKQETPGHDWPEGLKSLWYDAKGNWKASHDIAQDMPNALGSSIHAYLHRKEGDAMNARYWYRQAGNPFFKGSLEKEHRRLVESALSL